LLTRCNNFHHNRLNFPIVLEHSHSLFQSTR
jgi:hypothetical protein